MDKDLEQLLEHPFVTLRFRSKIQSAYDKQQSVKQLDLLNVALNAFEVGIVLKVLSQEKDLEGLRLNFSKSVKTEDIKQLMCLISEEAHLKSISIHSMFLQEEVSTCFFDTISSLKKLTSIHLSCHELTPIAAQKLVIVLKNRPFVEKLSIIVGQINAEYFQALAGQAKDKKVEKVVLGTRQFSNASCCILAELIRENHSMQELDLCVDEIENVDVLIEALQSNVVLKRITVTNFLGNHYPSLQPILDEICKRNTECADRFIAIKCQVRELEDYLTSIQTSRGAARNTIMEKVFSVDTNDKTEEHSRLFKGRSSPLSPTSKA